MDVVADVWRFGGRPISYSGRDVKDGEGGWGLVVWEACRCIAMR